MPNIQWFHGFSHENFLISLFDLSMSMCHCVCVWVCLYMLMFLSSHTSHCYPLWRLANLSITGEKELWKQWHKVRTSQKTIWWNLHFKNEMNIDMASVPDSDPFAVRDSTLAICHESPTPHCNNAWDWDSIRQVAAFCWKTRARRFFTASRLFSISSWRVRSPCCRSS